MYGPRPGEWRGRFARLLLVLIALVASAGPIQAQTPAGRSGVSIDLNIPALRIDVFESGRRVKSYPVAVGQPGHATPVGSFTISRAEWNPWWRPPPGREWTRGREVTPPGPNNPMGRVKMFFAPLYFIHGTPEEGSLGTPASHGCVRMRNEDAIELATLLHERASPSVHAREIERILASQRTTRNVAFRDSVALTIRYRPVVVEGDELVAYPDIYRRRAIHTEAVMQALLEAGYEVSGLEPADVRTFVERARSSREPVRMSLDRIGSASPRTR